MLIKYTFQKGKAVEVEVPEELGGLILRMEAIEHNGDRRETRRHESLDDWSDKDPRAEDDSADVAAAVLRQLETEALYAAVAKLKPDEQDLIRRLYLDKHPLTQAEYARLCGVTENAVQLKAAKIRKKLKQILS